MSGGLFDLFHMSQEEEDVLSLEYFDTAEAGSSADEMDDCLSVVSEMEKLAVAEATSPKISKVPAGAEAPGSDELMESPGHKARRKKNKGRSRYGPDRAERRKRQALSRHESKGGLWRGRPEGKRSHPGAPPVWGVPWRGVGSGSLTCGDTVCRHTSPRFSGTWVTRGRYWEGQGVCTADDPESLGGTGRGPVWLLGRTAECHRMPGGSQCDAG